MTTPFLTYELLTPETADPVVIRITGQREIELPEFKASNGIPIRSVGCPRYYRSDSSLYIRGTARSQDNQKIIIPLADWPAVKQAIRELNEAKAKEYRTARFLEEYEQIGEKDMKHDKYTFEDTEWEWSAIGRPSILTVTRKKPKVKVEWGNVSRFGDGLGEDGIDFTRHGYERYHIVQFRVTGRWPQQRVRVATAHPCSRYEFTIVPDLRIALLREWEGAPCEVFIGLDARDKWSAPVLLPESVYEKLPAICEALEGKANA